MREPSHWAGRRSPTLADFERLAERAWQRLPEPFRQLASDVVIRVEDFPPREVLSELGIDSPFGLLGLYQGVSLRDQSVMGTLRQPNMIFLYRRPILDFWAGSDERLGHLVAHVLIHEVGHHFGLSDADIESIEAGVRG